MGAANAGQRKRPWQSLAKAAIAMVSESAKGDLLPCGEEPLRLLRSSLDLLASVPYAECNFTTCVLDCEKIIAQCNTAFHSSPWKDVPRYWRRLYADAAILKAVCKIGAVQLAQPASQQSTTCHASSSKRKVEDGQEEVDHEGHDDILLDCIRSLDLAIVVAGAPGPGRKQMILDLIEVSQSCLSDRYFLQEHNSKKARQSSDGTMPISPSTETLQHPQVRATLPIPEPTSAPTFDSFILKDHQSPFVLRGFAKDWPACEKLPGDQDARWASGQYLLEVAGGRGRVVPCEVGGKYSDEDWGQQILPWQDFLTRSGWQVNTSKPADDENSSQTLYLAQHTLFDQFPKLEADILPPDYVFASAEIPEYTPPVKTVEGDEEEGEQRRVIEDVVKSVWIGPEGTVSPAHTDPHFNCYTQVVGRKLVWVGPPSCKVGMYCFGASTPSPPPTSPRTSPHRKTPERKGPEEDPAVPDWQSLQSNSDSTASTAEDKGVDLTAYMTNTSRVDVFSSVPTVEDEFPRFTDEVEPEAMWTVLEPGDMLFLPPLWYHGMKSLERSFSVSMWF